MHVRLVLISSEVVKYPPPPPPLQRGFLGFVFFRLIFVIKGFPGEVCPVRGVFRGVLGHVGSDLRGFRGCSGPVPGFTDTQL